MRSTEALALLRKDPQDFLDNNIILIGASKVEGQQVFHFGHHQRAHDLGNETIFKLSNYDDGILDPIEVTCQNLPMIARSQNLDFTRIPGYEVRANPDLLVTGQLSGCSYCVLQRGSQILVAHIQPRTSGPRSLALQTELEVRGRFQRFTQMKITTIYGATTNYTNYAYVIGLMRPDGWEIYGQAVTSSNVDAKILKVKRIH